MEFRILGPLEVELDGSAVSAKGRKPRALLGLLVLHRNQPVAPEQLIDDLWGDSVNTASRMESHGVPNEIQVSQTTWQLLRDKFAFEERGVIDVKSKGPMRTYFLRGRLTVTRTSL